MVAQDLRRPRRRAIEEAASVFCSVCAKAVDFKGLPVVEITANRSSHNRNAYKLPVCGAAD